MRHIISLALLAALTQSVPTAFAQPANGTDSGMHAKVYAARTAPGDRSEQGGAENCGTPDNFKSCPPLPRHPLQSYPGPK